MKAAAFGLGCLSLALTWALLGIGTYTLMATVHEPGLRVGLALLSALLLTLGLRSFWSLAWDGHGARSLETLIRRARKGEPPEDGKPVVADGFVRPLSSPLMAPLSGGPCAAYWYSMYFLSRTSKGTLTEVPVYWGYACRPFAIDSPVARIRVLAVPLAVHDAEPRQGPEAVERARELVATTRFEAVGAHLLATVGTAFELARDVFNDDDGDARRDWKREGDERDPGTLLLKETLLPVGAAASAHGLWSAERGAIVSEGGALGTFVSVTLGRPEKLRNAPGVGHSTGAYLVTATLLTALGAGLVWFSIHILPTM